jgi:HSP20 family protein
MATKEVKEIVKRRIPKPAPFWGDIEDWVDNYLVRPFPFLKPSRLILPQQEELIPSVDIFEEGNDVVVKAELPGIKKEDIDITLTDNTIMIAGEKKKEKEIDKKDYYRWESSYGSFNRTFSLPAEVKLDKVKSIFKDGILEIRLPKTEEAKKKEIKLKVE